MRRGFAVIALLIVFALLFRHRFLDHKGPQSAGVLAQARAPVTAGSPPPASEAATATAAGSTEPVDQPSHLADQLNSPSTDIHADLRLLNEIFIHYRSAVRSDNPVGDNADITAALTGRNRLAFAFIPKDHPAINSRGELCDRWGTPYFFHQLSGQEMEIRSAGPDRKMWTSDDEVLTPGF